MDDVAYVTFLVDLYKKGIHEGLGLNPKQEEALRILTDNHTEALTFGGGANGGKSWLGCTWLMMNASSYPETRWFIGREELKRITESTLISFFKVAKSLGIPSNEFKYNGQRNFIQFKNGSRIDLLELKYLPSDPLYERFGSTEYTGGWIEEGGEVHFKAFEVLKTRIGRHLNDKYNLLRKILITCNPKKNWLYTEFYKPFIQGILKSTYKFIQSLITDNFKRESGSFEALQGIKDKTTKARLLDGEWEYDSDPAKLIEYDKIIDCFTNSFVKEGKKYITADIARFGKDNTVIVIWNGWRAMDIISINGNSIAQSAQQIGEIRLREGIPISQIVVDEDGVGGGVMDILGCRGFVNGSQPIEIGPVKENYSNLKSQCYFRLAERINKGEVYIRCDDMDKKEKIVEELEQVKQRKHDSDGKKEVLKREEMVNILGRSPDYASALMMREYFELKRSGEYTIL